jgi:hypothetical protein
MAIIAIVGHTGIGNAATGAGLFPIAPADAISTLLPVGPP